MHDTLDEVIVIGRAVGRVVGMVVGRVGEYIGKSLIIIQQALRHKNNSNVDRAKGFRV